MSRTVELFVFMSIVLAIYACATTHSTTVSANDTINFEVPKGWPVPIYDFNKNPLSSSKIELGRLLFYDPILSRDSTISCASCHLSYTAFTHTDHDLSHGIADRVGTRNSSALTNLAWSPYFMWDGAVNHLDMQALAPISHPDEMDFDISEVIARLHRSTKYDSLFKEAWNGNDPSGELFLKSLSQFLLTLVSANSKYDQVLYRVEGVTFTPQESRGYNLFKKKCASCHTEPLFTNYQFVNNGLKVDPTLNDYGRMMVTGDSNDSLKFKVPSLRNIEFSDPYMHDGRFRKLQFVMRHYGYGLHDSETLAPELKNKLEMSPEERVDIIAFLMTLTDKEFLFNEDFAYPR